VTATSIEVRATTVTSGVGDFLKEAGDGIQAAFNEVNAAGGICGRRINFSGTNTGWDGPTGQKYIEGWIHADNVFALVGQPDSEGLGAATEAGVVDRAKFPVVGSDGMLKSQYHSPWVWPVAASTVSNMHIVADWAVDAMHASSFGIVYDTQYRFGAEGAKAFAEELKRRGKHIEGYGAGVGCSSANKAYCGISSDKQTYTEEVNAFNNACKPCDVVVMLLEPRPMIAWMNQERNANGSWYRTLVGGEPLFDDNVGNGCPECGKAKLVVWTGYRPAIEPFDAEKPVARFCQALLTSFPSDDCHNEFTEGAYLGARMFVDAVERIAELNLPLSRDNLKAVLDSRTFSLGMTYQPLGFPRLPHISNACMTAFSDNYSGSFNGWSYRQDVSWLCDKNAALDI
jgi:ABC-type branched-subunit amino acid transport system substrate-binding protein